MSELPPLSPHIEALEAYQSARRIGGRGHIWLNANESPFARAPMAMDASEYHRYPDQRPAALEAAYARYAGVRPENVLALRGADEAIDLLTRAWCRAGSDRILLSSPTYGMYQICAQIQHAGVVDVPLSEDFELDVPAICAAEGVRLVWLCHPNNPTGNPLRRDDLLSVIEQFAGRAVVAIDEAYIEFCSELSLLPLLARYPHLVIVRTLSKAFGLAGVHVGFLLANPGIMDIMRKVVAPYPIADPCAQIALHALSEEGVQQMRAEVQQIAATRRTALQALDSLPAIVEARASRTNFLMLRCAQVDRCWDALTAAGIVARRVQHPRLRDVIRVSIGTDAQMQAVVAALREMG